MIFIVGGGIITKYSALLALISYTPAEVFNVVWLKVIVRNRYNCQCHL